MLLWNDQEAFMTLEYFQIHFLTKSWKVVQFPDVVKLLFKAKTLPQFMLNCEASILSAAIFNIYAEFCQKSWFPRFHEVLIFI